MGLSCGCDFDSSDCDSGQSYYYYSYDFSKLNSKQRKRCVGCKTLIDIGSDVVAFARERVAYNDIDENINGECYSIASHYLCEKCGGIFLNLEPLGYCPDIYSINDELKEYQEMTGFDQIKKAT